MSWNHRILAHEIEGDIIFQVHEVYYKDDLPTHYTQNPIPIAGESIKDINWAIYEITKCTKIPLLWAGDRFPESYK